MWLTGWPQRRSQTWYRSSISLSVSNSLPIHLNWYNLWGRLYLKSLCPFLAELLAHLQVYSCPITGMLGNLWSSSFIWRAQSGRYIISRTSWFTSLEQWKILHLGGKKGVTVIGTVNKTEVFAFNDSGHTAKYTALWMEFLCPPFMRHLLTFWCS